MTALDYIDAVLVDLRHKMAANAEVKCGKLIPWIDRLREDVEAARLELQRLKEAGR